MSDQKCPPPDQLQAYVLGQLPWEHIDEVARHVDRCAPCEDTVANLEASGDTIVSGLAAPVESNVAGDERFQQALALVKQVGRDAPGELQPGERDELPLGRLREYELLEKLGEGGMGAVYKARHRKLDKIVAIKVLPPQRMQDAQAVARFEREMRAVGKVEHPNIVRATDAGEADGSHFLVMEYVAGVDLSRLAKRVGPLPIADACEIIRQAADGLQHACEHGLVHRDIKPSNLMLMVSGERQLPESAPSPKKASSQVAAHKQGADAPRSPIVKILDLGLALLPERSEDDTELTSTGQAMGTLDYMAPEQGGDSHDVDVRADIYALGATLYRLLAGQAIYSGPQYKTMMDKWRALATEDAAPIQSRRHDVPDALAEVVHRMLARDKQQRYASPAEVAAALAPFCTGANLPALAQNENGQATPLAAGSTTSLLKEAGSLETSGRPENSADLVPTQPAGATAGLSSSAKAKPQAAARRKKSSTLLIAGGAGLLGLVALAAALVFYFQTPHGTLRVEINDPDIEVKIKGEDIVLTGADPKPIKLQPGEHTLIVTRGEFTFETKDFTLKKGETTTVKVELLPGKVQVVSRGAIIDSHSLAERNPTLANSEKSYALHFDGDDKVQFDEVMLAGDAPITVETWVRPRTIDSDVTEHVVVFEPLNLSIHRQDKHFSIYPYAIGFSAEGGEPFLWEKGNGSFSLRRDETLDAWIHLAATVDTKGRVGLFINGKLQRVQHGRFSPRILKDNRRKFQIGAGFNTPPKFHFVGDVRAVRISSGIRYRKDFKPARLFQSDQHTLALYHFDEGAGDVLKDSSGNGHHGKITGAKWVRVGSADTGSTKLAAAEEGANNALYFDGESGTGAMADLARPWAPAEFTIEARVLTEQIKGSHAGMVECFTLAKLMMHHGWAFSTYNGSDGLAGVTDEKKLPLGRSAHVAGVFKDGTMNFYIDGKLAAQGKVEKPMRSGRRIHIGSRGFTGQIDEVRISSVARYNGDFTPPAENQRFRRDEHTFALYHFDEGTGEVFKDSSGNGHHGKIAGAKWVKVNAVAKESAADDAGQNNPRIGSMGAPILAEPVEYEATQPLNRHCLVPYPAPIEGVRSWTVATRFHRGAARQMHFSPDGKYLAYLADGALRICDGQTFEPVRTFMRPRMREIAWLPDSRAVSVATETDEETTTVHVWSVEDGSLQRRIDLPFRYPFGIPSTGHAHLAWSGDRRLAAARGDTKVLIYDWDEDKVVQELAHPQPVANVAWSPDDARLAVSSHWREAAAAYVWNAEDYELLHTLDGSPDPDKREEFQRATAPLWCCGGERLAAGFRTGAVVWDAATGERKPAPQVNGKGQITDLLPTSRPDEIVAVGKKIWLWNVATGKVRTIWDTTKGVASVVCHPKTGRLHWGNEWSGGQVAGLNLDGLYDVRDVMQRLRRRHGIPDVHGGLVLWSEDVSRPEVYGGIPEIYRGVPYRDEMIATPDGELAAITYHRENRFTVARDGLVIGSFPDEEDRTEKITQLALEADGSSVAAITQSGTVRAWELPAGTLLGELQAPGYEADGRRIFITARRRCVIVSRQGRVAISEPNFKGDFQVYGTRLGNDVALSPDGKQLAFYTQGGVQLLDVETLKRERLPGPPGRDAEDRTRCIEWRNANTLVLYTNNEQLALYDAASGELLRSYRYPWERHPFWSVHYESHFGTAGRYFVSRQWGNNARLLDTTNGWVESIVRYWDAGFLHVGATGHYDASANVAPNVMYVVELDSGDQLNLTPAEFEKRFGWQNDPSRVRPQG